MHRSEPEEAVISAGVQSLESRPQRLARWILAFAGMTGWHMRIMEVDRSLARWIPVLARNDGAASPYIRSLLIRVIRFRDANPGGVRTSNRGSLGSEAASSGQATAAQLVQGLPAEWLNLAPFVPNGR
jgi:hypothetical protein